MNAKRVLVTGANGFIGQALCEQLATDGFEVTATVRSSAKPTFRESIRVVSIGGIDGYTNWEDAIEGVEIVVHLAARVHVMSERDRNPMKAYQAVNVEGTRHLVLNAVNAGVKRFVYLSTVKVNGEERPNAYKEEDCPSPVDRYGISKLQGENHLKSLAIQSGMEFVILRPPMVYGPRVRANFLALMNLIDWNIPIPLPLSGIQNRRSFIYIGNLLDCICKCMQAPAAANQVYFVSDDSDLSTPDLIRSIADALEKRCFLFTMPTAMLRTAGKMMGKGDAINRLLGSLFVDISKIKNELHWRPPFSVETGLRHTAKWYTNK